MIFLLKCQQQLKPLQKQLIDEMVAMTHTTRVVGTPLGGKFVFRWIDDEPTGRVGLDVVYSSSRKILLGCAAAGAIIGFLLDGGIGALLCAFFFAGWAGKGISSGLKERSGETVRNDDEHVTRPVERQASVEYQDGSYWFVVTPMAEVENQSVVMPWASVTSFAEGRNWAIFGTGNRPAVGSDWNVVAAYPPVGAPQKIASTTAGHGAIYALVTELNHRFGASARDQFMRELLAQKKATSSSEQSAPMVPRRVSDGVPESFN